MTGQEIIARLEEFFGGNGDSQVANYCWDDYEEAELGLGKIEEVDQYGGEGQGETWYKVNHFVDHNVYIRTDGFYSSYNGTDFDEGFGSEVRPISKTITVFE